MRETYVLFFRRIERGVVRIGATNILQAPDSVRRQHQHSKHADGFDLADQSVHAVDLGGARQQGRVISAARKTMRR
jgi:hypothetical protein